MAIGSHSLVARPDASSLIVAQDGKLGPHGAVMLAVLQEIAAFYSDVLAPICAELLGVATRDFETRRQQIFLSDAAQFSSPSGGDATLAGKQLMPVFMVKVNRLREAIRLVGLPVTEVREDWRSGMTTEVTNRMLPHPRRSVTWRGC